MREKMTTAQSLRKLCKAAIPVLLLLAAAVIALTNPDCSVQTVLSYTPENPVSAACVLLLLYVLKSATIVFPVIVLEIAAGYLFQTRIALLINLAGLLIILTVPYWVGRISGINTIKKLIQKYPKYQKAFSLPDNNFPYFCDNPKYEALLTRQQSNSLFLCFFLRVISCLPGDVVTMYLGATKTSYLQNVTGGLFGVLPGMILATVLGAGMQDPSSPAFRISIALTVFLSAASAGVYSLYRRRLKNKER